MFKNNTCECKKISTTYYVASAGCADDDAAVATLPDMWVPKHSGPILTNYLKERAQNHDTVLQDLTLKAKTVNENIDTKIRALAEALLAHIQYNKKEMACIIEHCDPGDTALEKEYRDEALKKIYQLHARFIDEMANFKRETAVVERERVDGLKTVLRDQFHRLISIGHRPPKDLLHDFDDRAYQINQQLLSNTRAYADLEAQLRVQVDEGLTRARSALNQFCLGVSKSRAHSALPWASEEQTVITGRSPSAVSVKKHEVSMSSLGLLLGDVEEIDACVMRVVQAYKAAVLRVFTGFSNKLNDLEKDLGANHYCVDLDNHSGQRLEFHEMIDKTLCRLSTSIHKKNIASRELLEMTGTDMLSMQKSLWSLGGCLQDTFNILNDAGHLWDAHILREALAQKLAIAAVEDLLTSNDTIQMANEVTFNVALEQLRGSSDADKLQSQYESLIGMLDRTSDMYRIHSEAELGRLEEFMNLPTPLANTLLAEFKCFLEKYPRSVALPIVSSSNQQVYTSPKTTNTTAQSPLPRAILQTELQEIALRNWRNGFLESFESNVSLVPAELRRQARLWVEERAKALHMRFSLKMVSHSIRVERINAARKTRQSELHYHEERLTSHLDALHQLADNLPVEASQFSSPDAPYLYPFSDWVSLIQKRIDALNQAQEPRDPEVVRLKMSSYAARLAKYRSLYEESVNVAVETFKRHLEHRIQNARISNVRFVSQIKLFSEGGHYAAQEATRACSALVKGAETLEACVNRTNDAINSRRHQLLALADQRMLPLLRVCEAVIGKSGVKTPQNKGKPSPAKKK